MKKNALGFYQISQKEAKEMIDNGNVVILDVREEYEYKEGNIENSILIPLGEIMDDAQNKITDKEEIILVYCRSGRRSITASFMLTELGYKNVYEFGGIITWEYGIVNF